MNQYPLSLFDGGSAIVPMLLCAVVLVVPTNVTFLSLAWQSTLFRPSTRIMAGLVRVQGDSPSSCGR